MGAGHIACLSTTNTVCHARRSAIAPFHECIARDNDRTTGAVRSAVATFTLSPAVVAFLVDFSSAGKSATRRGAYSRTDALLGAGVGYAAAKRPGAGFFTSARHGRPAGRRSWGDGPAADHLGPLCHAQLRRARYCRKTPIFSAARESAWPRCRSFCSTSI